MSTLLCFSDFPKLLLGLSVVSRDRQPAPLKPRLPSAGELSPTKPPPPLIGANWDVVSPFCSRAAVVV